KGVVAFPVLMEYAEDKRFSFLMESPSGAMRTHTVGDACRLIVQHQLDAYETLGIYPRMVPSYFDKVVAGKKWDGWWHSHRDKSLREMQIEAFDWAVNWQKELLEYWETEEGDAKQELEDAAAKESKSWLQYKSKKEMAALLRKTVERNEE